MRDRGLKVIVDPALRAKAISVALRESATGTFAPWRRPSEVVGYAGAKQSS
jgi:hypothetical protein